MRLFMVVLVGMLFVIVCVSIARSAEKKVGDIVAGDLVVGTLLCQPYWTYEPKKDITTYELALIVQFHLRYLNALDFQRIDEDIKDLGTGARHFTKHECAK